MNVVINFLGNANDIEKTIKTILTEIDKIKLPSLQTAQVEQAFDKVYNKIEKYREALDKPTDFNKLTKSAEELEAAYLGLIRVIEKTTNLDPGKLLENFNSQKLKDINKISSAVQNEIEREEELVKQKEALAKADEDILLQERELANLLKKQRYTKKVTEGNLNNQKATADNLKNEYEVAKSSLEYLKALSYLNKYGDEKTTPVAQHYRDIINAVNELGRAAEEASLKYELMNNRFQFDKVTNSLKELREGKIEILDFIDELSKSSVGVKEFKELLKLLGIETVNGINIDTISSYKELQTVLLNASSGETDKFILAIKNINLELEKGLGQVTNNTKEILGYAEAEKIAATESQELSNEIKSLTARFSYLFGLTGTINVFRKAIRNAYSAIKELDAAMTEQAVVTDYSISDLWDQLPEYTKLANELGVATKEAYDAATLYYQLGLDTALVTDLTTSTLKMARIAGLDAATATDRMTNALRGFNMELNDISAERVADVYSELAAVSATDVNELSVAMTKTASIANSAGMTFENTAAYLAQMLETTRESAETAGTALKTVIGRFTEVKKLYNEGLLSGSDTEGEEINVNKVAAALKTAGIDMNRFFTGEVGLDTIFNELAEKWDDLTIILQRYIATEAAGSRQQSRFIAMLGDYNRLMELLGDAVNAAGASLEQYEKTLDSLETKLNKLENAWNEFTLGLMNSDFLKGGVDLVTLLVNLLSGATTSSSALISSLTKLLSIIMGLFLGKTLINNAKTTILNLGSKLRGPATKAGIVLGNSLAKGMKKGAEKATYSLNETLYTEGFSGLSKELLIAVVDSIRFSESMKLSGEAAANANNSINTLRANIRSGMDPTLAVQLFKSEIDALNISEEDLILTQNKLFSKGRDYGSYVTGFSSALMGLCGVLELVKQNSEESSSALDGLTSGLSTAATTAFSLVSVVKNIGFAITGEVGLIIAAISAVIGLISGVSTGITEQLQKQEEELELQISKANEAISASEQLKEEISSLDSQYQEFLETGTASDSFIKSLKEIANATEGIDYETYLTTQEWEALYKAIRKVKNEAAGAEADTVEAGISAAEKQVKSLSGTEIEPGGTTRDEAGLGLYLMDLIKTGVLKLTFTAGEFKLSEIESISDAEEKLKALQEWKNNILKDDEITQKLLDESEYYLGVSKLIDNLTEKVENYYALVESGTVTLGSKAEKIVKENKNLDITNVNSTEAYREYSAAFKEAFLGSEDSAEAYLLTYLPDAGLMAKSWVDYEDEVLSKIKNEEDKDKYKLLFSGLESNGLLSYALTLNPEDYTTIEEYVTAIQQSIADNMDSKLSGLSSTISSITDLLIEDMSFKDVDMTALTSALSSLPGLYNNAITAEKEFAQLLSSGAGFFEQIAYLNDVASLEVSQTNLVDILSESLNNATESMSQYGYVSMSTLTDITDELVKQADAASNEALMLSKAVGMIGTNLQVDSGSVKELFSIFPELASLSQLLADGTILLSSEVAEAVLGNAGAIVLGDSEKTVALIENQITELEAKKATLLEQLDTFVSNAATQTDIEGLLSENEAILAQEAAESSLAAKTEEIDSETGLIKDVSDYLAESADLAAQNMAKSAQSLIDSLAKVGELAKNVYKFIASGGTIGLKKITVGSGSIKTDSLNEFEMSDTDNNISDAVNKIASQNKKITESLKERIAKVISDYLSLILSTDTLIASLRTAQSKLLSSVNDILLGSAVDSGSGGSDSSWKNDLDWLYNLEQDITEEKRIQKILQEQLNDLEKDSNATGLEKLDNLNKQLENLEKQKALLKLLYEKRSQELAELLVANSGYLQYAGYNQNDRTVEIDWNKINNDVASGALTEDDYKNLEDYISRLEDIEQLLDDSQDEMESIDDLIKEINDYYHDDYVEFENRILDAIIELREREIKSIENVSDSIDNANDKLIESISNSIDLQRLARNNEKLENELTNLEQRIAYLSMDTSGANQLEILDLQKQLDDARLDYTDSLIDLKINELEALNDKASEQRQALIDLMNEQLKFETENGVLWAQVLEMIDTGFGSNGVLLDTSRIVSVISLAENWKSLSTTQRKDMSDELKTLGSSSWAYLLDLKTLESGGYIVSTLDKIATLIGTNSAGATGTGSSGGDGGGGPVVDSSGGGGLPMDPPVTETKTKKIQPLDGINRYGWIVGSGGKLVLQINDTYKLKSDTKLDIIRTAYANTPFAKSAAKDHPSVGNVAWYLAKQNGKTMWFNAKQVKTTYKTGGLSTSTGPAWLDGTKSRPEYVLNADQTQGFLRLIDILDGFRNGSYSNSSVNTQTYGDFNVNIQVDLLANDYDTDKLVKQIKKEIYSDASYRNFNNVTRLR